MSSKSIKHINLVQDTKVNLESMTNVLPKGLIFHETDTNKLKLSDGNSAYTNLPYTGGSELGDHASTETTYGASTVDKYGHSRHYSGDPITLDSLDIPYLTENSLFVENTYYSGITTHGDSIIIGNSDIYEDIESTDDEGNTTTTRIYDNFYSTDLKNWTIYKSSIPYYHGTPIVVNNKKYYVYRDHCCTIENGQFVEYTIDLTAIYDHVKESLSDNTYIDFTNDEKYTIALYGDIIPSTSNSNQLSYRIQLRYYALKEDGTYSSYNSYIYNLYTIEITDITNNNVNYNLYRNSSSALHQAMAPSYDNFEVSYVKYNTSISEVQFLKSWIYTNSYYYPPYSYLDPGSYLFNYSYDVNIQYFVNNTEVFSAVTYGYNTNYLYKVYNTGTESGLLIYGKVKYIKYIPNGETDFVTENFDESSCIIKIPFSTEDGVVFDTANIKRWVTTTDLYNDTSHVISADIDSDNIYYSTIHYDDGSFKTSIGAIINGTDINETELSPYALIFNIVNLNSEIYYIGTNRYINATRDDENEHSSPTNTVYKYNKYFNRDNSYTDLITSLQFKEYKESTKFTTYKNLSNKANKYHASSSSDYGISSEYEYGHTKYLNVCKVLDSIYSYTENYDVDPPTNTNMYYSTVLSSSYYYTLVVFSNYNYYYTIRTRTSTDTSLYTNRYTLPITLSGSIYSASSSSKHMFVDSTGNVIISTNANGTSWNSTTIDFNFTGLDYINGQFIGFSSTQIATSSDGLNWTISTLPSVIANASYKTIIYNNNQYYLKLNQNIYVTTDLLVEPTLIHTLSNSYDNDIIVRGDTVCLIVNASSYLYLYEINGTNVVAINSIYIPSSSYISSLANGERIFVINNYFYIFKPRNGSSGDNEIYRINSDFSEYTIEKSIIDSSEYSLSKQLISASTSGTPRILCVTLTEPTYANYIYGVKLDILRLSDLTTSTSIATTPNYVTNYVKQYVNSKLNNKLITMDSTAIAVNSSSIFKKTITEDTTFTISTPSDEYKEFTLFLVNAGAYTVSFPDTVVFSNGFEPIFTSSGIDILKFLTIDGGESWYCKQDGQHVH